SWLKRRLVALALSFAIVIALSASIAVFTISGMVISYLKEQISYDLSWFWTFSIKSTRWIILFAFYVSMVSIMYKHGPAVSERWRLFSPGATLAPILAILAFSGFVYYINNFNAYNEHYSSIGTIIVLLI